MPFSPNRLTQILDGFARCKILVVGDLMLDEFLWGKVTRISPEAPVPVLDVQRRAAYPGGAANVARNLASLGAHAGLAGVVGEDEPGRHLLALLQEQNIATASIRAAAARPTTHKTRICAITRQLHDHLEIEDQQQIVRVDDETRAPLDPETKAALFAELRGALGDYDAVILEDYAKGLVDQELVALLIDETTKQGKILAVDPNPNNPFDWSGATVLKPNRREAFLTAGLPYAQDEASVQRAGALLQKRHDVRHLLITLGEAGMLLFEEGREPYHTPTRAQDVFDVSGAGDTAIAAFTLALAAGATGVEAAELANLAAGVVVGKLGTATLDTVELRAMFDKVGGKP